jgi:hypothetical protein
MMNITYYMKEVKKYILRKEITSANATGHYALLYCSTMQPKLKRLYLYYKI